MPKLSSNSNNHVMAHAAAHPNSHLHRRSARRSVFWQYGIILMAVQVVASLIIAWHGFHRIRSFHRQTSLDDLRRVAATLSETYASTIAGFGAVGGQNLGAMAQRDARTAEARITVIAPDGRVLADSEHEPALMTNHAGRPEILAAAALGQGADARRSDTTGIESLYFACTLRVEDGLRTVGFLRLSRSLAAVNAESAAHLRTLGLVGLAGVVLTLVVVLVVSRRVSVAITEMTDCATMFASGQLHQRAQIRGSGELAELAAALNSMAQRLSSQLDDIRRREREQLAIVGSMSSAVIALDNVQRVVSLNPSAERLLGTTSEQARGRLLQEVVRQAALNEFVNDATAAGGEASRRLAFAGSAEKSVFEAAARPLIDSRNERTGLLLVLEDVTRLRRLESVRSDFAANVSHELRTPITNIRGYAETLAESGSQDPERTSRYLGIILRNAARLEAIIEDLLALARLEQPGTRATLARDRVVIENVVESTITQHQDSATARHIRIETECEPGLAVSGSAPLLEQALGNLLSNAVKYSPKGTTVRITAASCDQGSRVRISVIDQGPGIEPVHLPRLFERFYRVDKARSRDIGGTGLGLAIAKHIALVHGGDVSVESRVGSGSCFSLVLPVQPDAPAEIFT